MKIVWSCKLGAGLKKLALERPEAIQSFIR
jgi:hypothetical protein